MAKNRKRDAHEERSSRSFKLFDRLLRIFDILTRLFDDLFN